MGVGRTSATRPSVHRRWTNCLGGVRSRLVDEYGAAVLLECVGVRLGLHQGGPVGEIAMRVTERREDKVQLLAVVWPTPQG